MNPFYDSDYVNKSHEALVELFEPRCDAAENFHALKKVFDEMPGDVSCKAFQAGGHLRFELGDAGGAARALQAAVDVQRDATGAVAAVFEALQAISLYTTQPFPSRIDCNAVATSITRCKPCQIVLTPGSPSLLRARKPPSCAINRRTSLSRGGSAG